MSVTVRPYRRGGWEVDIQWRSWDGRRQRERKRVSGPKSAARRWGEERERELLVHGPPEITKEVPTLNTFWPRFLDGYARANRQKPSGIAAKDTIVAHTSCSRCLGRGGWMRSPRGHSAAQGAPAQQVGQDGQQRAHGAERAVEEGSRVGRHRTRAVHHPLAPDPEAVGAIPRLRGLRAARRGGGELTRERVPVRAPRRARPGCGAAR